MNASKLSALSVGKTAALLATFFSLFYIVAQLAEWAGWLGSAGGPESASTPLGIGLLLTPSLLLGASFVALMVCVRFIVPPARQVFAQLAVQFATIYAVLISLVYYVQLTLVAPRLAEGRTEEIEVLLFTPFDSFLYSVDLLGYSFMSLATLFAGLALTGEGVRRVARVFLIANGCLLPFLALQIYFHWLIWPASLWAITFPASTLALYRVFADEAPA
jgi:hypothetical protein